jgi:hypothetical protein
MVCSLMERRGAGSAASGPCQVASACEFACGEPRQGWLDRGAQAADPPKIFCRRDDSKGPLSLLWLTMDSLHSILQQMRSWRCSNGPLSR